MKKAEIGFLCAVVLFAVIFSALSLSEAGEVIAGILRADYALAGVAGEARDIDVEKVKDLIRQRHLSDHEAEFYKKVPSLPEETGEQP